MADKQIHLRFLNKGRNKTEKHLRNFRRWV
nr:MAG TPA: hypothetical protein [Caudoviricetes sp.]